MSDQVLNCQAALIYGRPPVLAPDELLSEFNGALTALGHQTVAQAPMSSEHFQLFSNDTWHATVALHQTPFSSKGLDRALSSIEWLDQDINYSKILSRSRAHIVVTVGEGPTPLPFETPPPVDVEVRLEIFHTLIRLVTAMARPKAAHFCVPDRLYTPTELDVALTRRLPPQLVAHSIPLPGVVGPNGQKGTTIIAHQSHILLGKTLIIEGLPARVPLKLGFQLIDSLLTKHLDGGLPLKAGDRIRKSDDLTLFIRHAPPGPACPKGGIIASFWSEPVSSDYLTDVVVFDGHRGYTAISTPKAEISEPAERESELEWSPAYSGASGVTSSNGKSSSPPTWMILVGVGIFLWVGLPLLNIPQQIIESAFSNSLSAEP